MARRQEWYTENDDENSIIDGAANTKYALAQTFTLGTTGNNLTFNISQIKIKGKRLDDCGDITIQIQGVQPDGIPDGTTISTGILTQSEILTTDSWITVTMTSVALQAGQQYSLVVDPAIHTAADYFSWRTDGSTPAYTGGQQVIATGDGQTSWTLGSRDMMFQIEGGSYDGTLCTLADAVNKAGALASTASTEEILVSQYVKEAEGIVCAVTRFNWLTSYLTYSDDVKYILNQVVSDLAAISIITYDPSGYTDIVEAETMINVYRESVARGLSLLRNQDVKKFIEDA